MTLKNNKLFERKNVFKFIKISTWNKVFEFFIRKFLSEISKNQRNIHSKLSKNPCFEKIEKAG